MTAAIAAITGYLVGTIPTAATLGHLRGVDLRSEGSGNPGTNNALRIGGPLLAAAVLVVEAAKGYAAVWLGLAVADEVGAVAAGIGAIAGNVYNLWYRLSGGKGLGISLGVLAALWPAVLPVVVGTIVFMVLISRSAGIASLAAIALLNVSSVVWVATGWPTGGRARGGYLIAFSLALALIMSWKHWRDSPLNPSWRPQTREPASPGHR